MAQYIQRQLQSKLYQNIDKPEYLAIVGPRQAGKTTLLNHLHQYLVDQPNIDSNQVEQITFQDPELLLAFEQNPVNFIKKHQAPGGKKTYLLLDEYQYAAEGGQKLKLVYDTVDDLKIVITGSSTLELREISSQMVGRILRYQLNQLSYAEIISSKSNFLINSYQQYQQLLDQWLQGALSATDVSSQPSPAVKQQLQTIFEQYALYGSYPAVYLRQTPAEKQELLLNIYNTYIDKDVMQLLGLQQTEDYFKLLKYLAVTIGQQTNYSSIQRNLDLTYHKLERYLTALKHTYILNQVRPFYTNKINEITKSPIYYFYDTGLRNWLLRSFQPLAARTDQGHLVENCVLHRLQELAARHLELTEVKFWRKSTGAEVDFVLERRGQYLDQIPVEVKYRSFDRPTVSRSFRSFIKHYQPQIGLIATQDYLDYTQVEDTQILFMPVYLL
jgi:hypothetical protein